MKFKVMQAIAIAAVVTVGLGGPAAAIVDNSQALTDAFCSGACGVGSAIGFSRTVAQASPSEATIFSDVYNITLSEPGHIRGILFANNTLDEFRLINLNLGLEDGGVPVDPVGGYTVPNPPPFNSELQTTIAFSNLAAGAYQFIVTGLVPDDQVGGQYEFQGTISEVPLPAAGWLFLTALLGLFEWMRRTGSEPQTA